MPKRKADSQLRWAWLMENAIIPGVGILGVIYAALGGPVPPTLYPILGGMIAYPGARVIDRSRRENK